MYIGISNNRRIISRNICSKWLLHNNIWRSWFREKYYFIINYINYTIGSIDYFVYKRNGKGKKLCS